MVYNPNDPGASIEPDSIMRYLRRELQAIATEFEAATSMQLRILYSEPVKPRAGLLVYADGTEWDPGSGAGVYVYSGSAWVKL